MSNLENRVKPTIERLLAAGATTLQPSEQTEVALWATKCAMVFEALRDSRAYFYTEAERATVRATSALPPRTQVWIAKCVDLDGLFVTATEHSELPDHSDEGARMYATTFGVGHLALQVATLRMPDHVPHSAPVTTAIRQGPWDEATAQLAASTAPVQWPARLGLTGEYGLEAFAVRWQIG